MHVACAPSYRFRKSLGERAGARTRDPLIKSQMLYQLSYALSEGFEERA